MTSAVPHHPMSLSIWYVFNKCSLKYHPLEQHCVHSLSVSTMISVFHRGRRLSQLKDEKDFNDYKM